MSIVSSFNEMKLPELLSNSLTKLNYITPTPIQAKTIPLAIENNDILGTAQTGTGKTLAFIIPLITYLLKNPNKSGLILTPTRELAQQILTISDKILSSFTPKSTKIATALLIGGEMITRQYIKLKSNPRIVIGTPGRIIDHLSRKTLKPNFNFLVLDETDRMFDMGFGIQLEKIISQLPEKKQTLMFSATLPKHIENLVAKHLIKPKRITIDSIVSFPSKLKEETIKIKGNEKFTVLLEQLNNRTGAIIIFVKTKHSAESLSNNLCKNNHNASFMHGDLKQSRRYRVMNDFRQGKARIMVATDIAARGLDVPQIQHVINYDLPSCAEDYIHRVGRTARAGASGTAINLISSADQSKWYAIQKLRSNTKTEKSEKVVIKYKKLHYTNSTDKKNYYKSNKVHNKKQRVIFN